MNRESFIRSMEWAGQHAAWLTTLAPREGQQKPETFAILAYHYMRLAGVSPFDNNLNLNID